MVELVVSAQSLNTGEKDNEAKILLPEFLFINRVDVPVDQTLRDKIKNSKSKDKMVFDALDTILSSGPPSLANALSDWNFDDGIIFRRGKIYIPPDNALRREIVHFIHDAAVADDLGCWKTTELVQRDFWWPGMNVFIKNYVAGCAKCQANKPNTHPTVPPAHPIPHGNSLDPWSVVSMDFITDLPVSQGYDSILVAVDHNVTKGVIFMPCNKTCTANETADLYQNNVFRHFGLPLKIISDRGPQFASQTFQELCKKLRIRSGLSTTHHPQTDGETERINQELELYLRNFCNFRGTDWAKRLAFAEFSHNHCPHSVTKQSPFKLLMGYNSRVRTPLSPHLTQAPANEECLQIIVHLRLESQASHDLATAEMRKCAENPGYRPFEVGQKVWLEGKNIATSHLSAKLAPRRYSPYPVTQVLSPLTFKLKLPQNLKLLHPVFHALLLSPSKETTEYGPPASRLDPILVKGTEEYEVDCILQSRIRKHGRNTWVEYLIKWKGYNKAEETTWKHAKDLPNAQEAILEFHNEFPEAPRIRAVTTPIGDVSNDLKILHQLPRSLLPDYVRYIADRLDHLVVSSASSPPETEWIPSPFSAKKKSFKTS